MANKKENTEKYNSIHWWIRRKYGSADRCENNDCNGDSDVFEWSLIKGRGYERNIENYQQLCRKCHFAYDLRKKQKESFNKGRILAQKKRVGMKHTLLSRKKMSEALKGRVVWNKGKKWSEESKKKMSLSHIGKIPWNKGKKINGK